MAAAVVARRLLVAGTVAPDPLTLLPLMIFLPPSPAAAAAAAGTRRTGGLLGCPCNFSCLRW